MISVLIEVLRDLWLFVLSKESQDSVDDYKTEVVPAASDKIVKNGISVYGQLEQMSAGILDGSPAYVGVEEAFCLARPVLAFDTVIGVLKYGDEVVMQDTRGFFAHVTFKGVAGWVRVDDLVDLKESIYPTFRHGYQYNSRNEEVAKLRHLIGDEMLGGKLSLPLQPEELIFYLLKESGVKFSWPVERPRMAGNWQKILKGVSGTSIGIEPKTGSVMESTGNEVDSFIGLVTEVRPNNSIKLLSIGRRLEGEYREEIFMRDEWIEWRPVFISFT